MARRDPKSRDPKNRDPQSRDPRSGARNSCVLRGLLLLLLALGLTVAAPSAHGVSGTSSVSALHPAVSVLPGRTSGLDQVVHAPLAADLPSSTDLTVARLRPSTLADVVSSYTSRTSVTSRGPPAA